MSGISVLRLGTLDDAPESLLQRMEAMRAAIRQVAEQFVIARGGAAGNQLDDWYRAERQVCWAPQAELLETDTALHLLIGIPGVDPGQVEMVLTPQSFIVVGSALEQRDTAFRIHFSEFGTKKLYRKIDFPSPIHADRAVVTVENSMLRLSAAKLESADLALSSTFGA